jgi:hypothetical protein
MSSDETETHDRSVRRFICNLHVSSCAMCSSDADEMCEHGHQLLRDALDPVR